MRRAKKIEIQWKASDPAPRRVRRADAANGIIHKQDGFEVCLECWKAWMNGDPDKDLDAKTMGGMTANGDGYGVDPSEAQQARDTRFAIATDAMIDSLPRLYGWAIYKACSIGTAWAYPNADLLATFETAKELLTEKLKKNSCTGILF